MRASAGSCLLFVLAACASYQVQSLSGTAAVHLDKQNGVLVTVPQDGVYGTKTYPGSGQTVAQAVATAFSVYATHVNIAAKDITQDSALAVARKAGAGYLMVPLIVHWEQRETEWSGKPSKMSIRVTIFDAATGTQISSTSVDGESGTFKFTATTPESLLKQPLADFVKTLY